MIIIVAVYSILIIAFTEGRVYCEDTNASPWMPLGYSCPINCFNVKYAMERLKLMDYKQLLSEKRELGSSKKVMDSVEALIQTKNWTDEESGRRLAGGKYEEFKKLYAEGVKLLKNKNIIVELEAHLSKPSPKCSTILKKASLKPLLFKKMLIKCSRRSNVEEEFLSTLTDILNKYTIMFKFSSYMTKMLLQKILGQNMDLRNGVFDIMRILNYLKSAMSSQREDDVTKPTVNLKSKHCLKSFVSGCFCRPGYVEKSGRCVTPGNCTIDARLMKYLPRIIVH